MSTITTRSADSGPSPPRFTAAACNRLVPAASVKGRLNAPTELIVPVAAALPLW